MTSAFDKIAAGLEDSIAFAEGDTSRGRKAKANATTSSRLPKRPIGAKSDIGDSYVTVTHSPNGS